MTFRAFGVALLVLASGCVVVDLSNKPVFAGLTYGKDDRVAPPPKPEFQLYAALQFEVMGPWQQPGAAAQCLAALEAADLERIGRATNGARDAVEWAGKLWAELAPLRARPACAAGFAADPSQLAWAVGRASAAVFDFAERTWLDPARRAGTYAAGVSALQRLARLLAATPAGQQAQNDLPVLALSGGAANGAFTAGVLYELLSAREEALLRLPSGERAEADRKSRFSAVVGTSVGALLAQLLEFSMVDDTNLDADQLAFLARCNASTLEGEMPHPDTSGPGCFSRWPSSPFPEVAPIPGRPLQSCALKLLVRSFAEVDESDLLCAEPGSVVRAVGALGRPRVNLIRFDPLQQRSLDELLRLFSARMSENRMTRVVVSVEAQQNQLLGLDERACPSSRRAECLSSSVMASVVLPVFARPVSQTWSGFEPTGECGLWFDGGLRSELPALRAVSLSRPAPLLSSPTAVRVLAIDTGRWTPLPSARPQQATQVVLNTLEQYATQQDVAEFSAAGREAELRDAQVAALETLRGSPVSPSPSNTRRVQGLYVPADVPDWVVAGAGYSFDRYVMRGLFLWGRQVGRVQLGGGGDLASKLGWPAPVAEQLKAVIAERVANDTAFTAWLVDYTQPACPAFSTWRLAEGERRVNAKMPTCVEASAGPAYFSCPAGVWDAGGTP